MFSGLKRASKRVAFLFIRSGFLHLLFHSSMLCDFWLLLDLNISLFCFLSIEKESAFFALMKQQ